MQLFKKAKIAKIGENISTYASRFNDQLSGIIYRISIIKQLLKFNCFYAYGCWKAAASYKNLNLLYCVAYPASAKKRGSAGSVSTLRLLQRKILHHFPNLHLFNEQQLLALNLFMMAENLWLWFCMIWVQLLRFRTTAINGQMFRL